MIRVQDYNEGLKTVWDDFCNSSKTPMFMFHRNYMDYHSDRFYDSSLLFYDDDKLVGIFPASISGNLLVSHGGLTYGGLIQSTSAKQERVIECIDTLVEYCKSRDIDNVIYKFIPHIYHEVPSEEDVYAISRLSYEIFKIEASTVIDLENPLKMPKGRKAQISRARREGVEVKKCTDYLDFSTFIDLENTVLNERHQTKAVHTAEELYLLYSRFPNNIHLYGGFINREMISGVVLFEYNNAIHTQYMANSELGRNIGGLDLIIKTIMDEFCCSKKWLDFGISTEKMGSVLNEGLISQKEGFGGRTNVYCTWRINIK